MLSCLFSCKITHLDTVLACVAYQGQERDSKSHTCTFTWVCWGLINRSNSTKTTLTAWTSMLPSKRTGELNPSACPLIPQVHTSCSTQRLCTSGWRYVWAKHVPTFTSAILNLWNCWGVERHGNRGWPGQTSNSQLKECLDYIVLCVFLTVGRNQRHRYTHKKSKPFLL